MEKNPTYKKGGYGAVVENQLKNMIDPDFMLGQVSGIFIGIYDWFKDIVVMIWDLLKFIWESIQGAWKMLQEMWTTTTTGKPPKWVMDLVGPAKNAAAWLKDNSKMVIDFIVHLIKDPGAMKQLGADIKGAIVSAGKSMARSAGAAVAKTQTDFMGASAYDQGKTMGTMVGYIIPEIVLAFFTGTIGNWIKGGLKAFQASRAALQLMKGMRWLIELGKKMFGALEAFGGMIKKMASGTFEKLGEAFGKVLEFLKSLMGLEEKVPNKKGITKTKEVKDVEKVKTEKTEAPKKSEDLKQDKLNDAEKDAKEGGMEKEEYYDEKLAALIEAKTITEANDVIEPSIHPQLLVNLLNKIIPYKKVNFYYENLPIEGLNLRYIIWMKGSKVRVGNYDIEIPNIRTKKGEENFTAWFNQLTTEEFDKLWNNEVVREIIEDKIRKPGGLHEWLMVGRVNVFKKWGITMDQIKDLRTLTKETKFINPETKEVFDHGGKGSKIAHDEILKLIDNSKSFDDFSSSLNIWADSRILGGRQSLPKGLIKN
jgi:hypothetical protein